MRARDTKRTVRRSRRINGWFSSDAAGLFGLLDELQRAADVHGDLFEIGTHHGRSAVMLGAMARPGECLAVCDIFGNQSANVSDSGSGDRAIFERNMQRMAPTTTTSIYEKLSTDLTPAEIGGPYRFFHIDGGHAVEEALSDLHLGATVLDRRGVIVLDDPFRPEWPGVTEALLEFLHERQDFAVVALGFNKLVLTPAPTLYEAVETDRAWEYLPANVFLTKTQPIAGHDTLIFYTPTYWHMPGLDRLGVHVRTRAVKQARKILTWLWPDGAAISSSPHAPRVRGIGPGASTGPTEAGAGDHRRQNRWGRRLHKLVG